MAVVVLVFSCIVVLAVAVGVKAFRRSQEAQNFRQELADFRRNPEPDDPG